MFGITPSGAAPGAADIVPSSSSSSSSTSARRADIEGADASPRRSTWQAHSDDLKALFNDDGAKPESTRLLKSCALGGLLKAALMDRQRGGQAAADLAALEPGCRADWIAALVLDGYGVSHESRDDVKDRPTVAACKAAASLAPEVKQRLSRLLGASEVHRMEAQPYRLTHATRVMLEGLGICPEPGQPLPEYRPMKSPRQHRLEPLEAQLRAQVPNYAELAQHFIQGRMPPRPMPAWIAEQAPVESPAGPGWPARLQQAARDIVGPLGWGMQMRLGDRLCQNLGNLFGAGGGFPRTPFM